MSKNQQKNGATSLTPEQEDRRMELVDLEMKARYWKAQFEIRDYTLKLADIEPAYIEHLKRLERMDREAREKLIENLEMADKLAGEGVIEVEPAEKEA